MLVHSPHIRPGPDVRRNTVFVPWDTPPSPKPGLVPHRKICPAGEPFSHGGFFPAVENPPLGEKISWKRKSSIKNEKQTQGREEQRSSLPWVICNDWMNASSIFFLLILLCKNRVQSLKKVAVIKRPKCRCGRWGPPCRRRTRRRWRGPPSRS